MKSPFPLPIKLSKEDVTVSILVGVGLAFLVIWKLYPHLGFGQEYKDIVAGYITWSDYDKDREWRVLNILIAGTVVFSMSMAMFFHYLRSKELKNDFMRATHHLFCIACLPAVFWFGAKFITSNPPSFYPYITCVLITLVVFVVVGLSKYKEESTYEDITDVGLSSIFILFLGLFSILAIAVAISEFSVEIRDMFRLRLNNLSVFSCAAAFLFIISNVYLSSSLVKCKYRFHISLLLLQACIPLLLFVYVTQYYFYEGEILSLHRSVKLAAAVLFFIVLSWIILFRRFTKINEDINEYGNISYENVLSAAALSPLAVYFVWCTDSMKYNYNYYSFFNTEWSAEYHIAEQLLPWQQIIDFGRLPYFDFAPLHGLMSMLYGGLNELFYGHTAATFTLATSLLLAIAVWLTFIALFRFAGPLTAITLTFFAGNMNMDRFYFLAPAILLLSHPNVTGQGKIWLPVWIVTCLFSVFYNVAIGAGIIIGTLPAALYMAWRVFREDRKWTAYFLVLLIVIVIVILLVSPLREITFSFIEFITSNASTNTIAHSTGMFETKRSVTPQFLLRWNLFKVSWILVALVAVVLFFRAMVAGKKNNDSRYLWLAGLLPVTLFMIAQWALNRVLFDMNMDRSSNLSYIAVVLFLPLLIAGFSSDATRNVRIILFAFIIGLTSSLFYKLPGYNVLTQQPFINERVPEGHFLISGKDSGFPRLGEMFAVPKITKELKELRLEMAPYLRPGETFLDLTNRSSLHFYLDMPVPVWYSSNYAAASTKSYSRMIQQIIENPPPLVLIAPYYRVDSGPASLRSYLLYRELVDSYIPKQIGEHSFLVRPDRLDIDDRDNPIIRMQILDDTFSIENLKEIPNAWGRSWHILKDRFSIAATLDIKKASVHDFAVHENKVFKPVGNEPRISFDIQDKGLSGKDIDHILLQYECTGKKDQLKPVIELSWETDYEEPLHGKNNLFFAGTGTMALIPVGVQPRWRFANKIKTVHLNLRNYKSCDELYVNDISMLTLN